MPNENTLIKAIYEVKRQNLLLAWLNEDARASLDNAYVYAYENRLYPIYHADEDRIDAFEKAYEITKQFVDDVTKYVDEKWINQEYDKISFNILESKFGGYQKNRYELIAIFRYCFLANRFDNNFYSALLRDCPSEAHNINRELQQVYL